ncbi:Rab-family small GTPase (macronuclear) [Tetrahymena thermophila SB210]|uniref:Rab-family small GTPase n=2 Tax=Tetrahymena thermophila TaxID=5911 RepID=Q22YA7_TETTS|nr:Rab-family small GTPase [Tetrahymena thermophila SB210]EAR90117.1 Rab-family small GTPase [Tetrahymena thermophila SB210]BAJ21346.1 Rab-family small GTPase Rab11F [Tetrahymena thermophila]|eukprot:XP_001010362.1 Rab-family small GTPase [Tetrahymena thermophila SB210]
MADTGQLLFKIIMLGETGVGKSQMLQRYTKNKFTEDYVTTIGAEFATTSVKLNNGQVVQVQIWDTAGQEKFRSITRAFYRGAVGAVLVYDISDQQTFKKCDKWLDEIKQYNQDNQIAILLVGNKKDLIDKQQVNNQEALNFAQSKNLALAFCSAKTGDNVKEAFTSLIEEIYQQHEKVNSLANKQESQNENTQPKQQVDQQVNSRSEFKKNEQGQSLLHPSKTEPKKKPSGSCC